jgi:GNAT superfamily N-acetyltransferase
MLCLLDVRFELPMIRVRDFHWDEDFEKVCTFLAELQVLTQSIRNWIPSRFENRKFGPCGPEYRDEEDGLVKIWEEIYETNESFESRIVAVTVLNDSPDSYPNIHPNYEYLASKVILEMEKERAAIPPNDDSGSRIVFMVEAEDRRRTELLQSLGYEDLGPYEHNRIRPLNSGIPDYSLPEGYSIRQAVLPKEFEKYREVLGSVFSHCGRYMTEASVKKYSEASFWHEDLDLVAVAPDGSFAAFTTVRVDPTSGIAEFEPVGTHPDHRKLGLAKGVILEGLRRLLNHNPTLVCIPGAAANEGATRLYDSLGFSRVDVHAWRKYLS